MKRLPVLISLSALAVASQLVFADTEFGDNVPIEVVRHFIGNPFGGEGAIYSDILAAFPPFNVPPDFEVLASTDQGYMQRVILSSSLDTDAAKAALAAAFVAESWVDIPFFGAASPQTGFVSAEQPNVVPMQFCHNDHGTLTIMVNVRADVRYVNISRNVGGPMAGMIQPGCAERLAQVQGQAAFGMGRGNILTAYVPTLNMPQPQAGANGLQAPRNSFVSGGGGGSQNDWETEAGLVSTWSIDEIYAHFATQVAEQGWVADSETTGAIVATGNWTKNIDNMNLVGTLSIVNLADNNWGLRLRLVRQGRVQNGAVNRAIDSTRITRDPVR